MFSVCFLVTLLYSQETCEPAIKLIIFVAWSNLLIKGGRSLLAFLWCGSHEMLDCEPNLVRMPGVAQE